MSQKLEKLRIMSGDKKAKTGQLVIAQLIADGFDAVEILPYFMNAPTKKAKDMSLVAAKSLSAIAPWFDTLVAKLMETTEVATLSITPTAVGESSFDPTSKEAIINEMKRQYDEAADPKQKADILVKLAELQRMKQEEVKEEQKHTMVYLPATCHDCPCMLECQKEHPEVKPLY